MAERLIVLDTETTGLSIGDGHRIIEVCCIELIERRRTGNDFYRRVNPNRPIDLDATAIHGIKNADVEREPQFSTIADELIAFVRGTVLIIHNAQFDLTFLDMEVERAGLSIEFGRICSVVDTLALARARHPLQKNTLDALCRRYGIDRSARAKWHGALIDAGLLADLYLAMTSGQSNIALESESEECEQRSSLLTELLPPKEESLRVIRATTSEIELHEDKMRAIHKTHVKTVEQKVKDLSARIKKIPEEIAKEGNHTKLEKLRQELRGREFDLSTTEAELPVVRQEGPRYF